MFGQLLCGMLVPHFVPHFWISKAKMIKLFDLSAQGDKAASQLAWLNQDSHSVSIPSSLEHWLLPVTVMKLLCALSFGRGWMMKLFEIVTQKLPQDFDSLVELALLVEGNLQHCHQRWAAPPSWPLGEGASNSALTSSPSVANPELIQVGCLCLTTKEK